MPESGPTLADFVAEWRLPGVSGYFVWGVLAARRPELHACSLRPRWFTSCKLRIVFFPGAIFRERSDPMPIGFVLLQFVVTYHVFRRRITLAEALSWDRPFE